MNQNTCTWVIATSKSTYEALTITRVQIFGTLETLGHGHEGCCDLAQF